jgi:hypothetical protein
MVAFNPHQKNWNYSQDIHWKKHRLYFPPSWIFGDTKLLKQSFLWWPTIHTKNLELIDQGVLKIFNRTHTCVYPQCCALHITNFTFSCSMRNGPKLPMGFWSFHVYVNQLFFNLSNYIHEYSHPISRIVAPLCTCTPFPICIQHNIR